MSQEEDPLQWLIDLGILKDLGYNEVVGDNLYKISDDADDYIPGLKGKHKRNVSQAVFDLWELEMIDVSFDQTGEPLVALNENSLDRDKINSIEDIDLKMQMLMLISIFDQHFNS